MPFDKTTMINIEKDNSIKVKETMTLVYKALKDKGYNPISQIVGYFLSGDPTYITSYGNARDLIRKLEVDEILEEIVKYYLESISTTNTTKTR